MEMKSAQLKREELHQLKWLLGQMLTLIALWTLAFLDFQALSLLVIIALLVGATLISPMLPGMLPPLFRKALTPLLVVFILVDFFMAGADVLPPLIRMVMILALVRCIAYRTRREDLQLLLLCLFMAVISGVLTLSLVFAFQILLFAPAAMVLLFIVNLLEGHDDKPLTMEDWRGFSWRHFIGRIVDVLDIRLAGFAGGLFILVVGVSSLIFMLMPRFQFDHAIPFFQMKTSSLSGFSDSVKLGGVTDIIEDNRIAFRMDPPSRDLIPANPYFRMLVLDHYSNGQFSLSRSVKNDRTVLMPFENSWLSGGLGLRVTDRPLLPGEGMTQEPQLSRGAWTFYLEGGISKYLPLLGPFQTLRFQNRQEGDANWGFLVIGLDSAKNGVFSYQAINMEASDVIAASRKDFTVLPEAEPVVASRQSDVWAGLEYPMTQMAIPLRDEDADYLRGVVDTITQGETLTAREFSRRAVDYLQSRHSYSLNSDVPAGERDKVVAWMQEDSPGHCEYFAGAFTILARMAGYPTRMVVGFNGGSWNTVEEYFLVRNRNAHAWCEIFDENAHWVRVDPTPGAQRMSVTGGGRGQGGLFEESGWSAWVDSLRILWYRSIVNFDDRSQIEIANQLRDLLQESAQDFRSAVEGVISEFQNWWDQPVTWGRALTLAGLLLALTLLYVLYLKRYLLQDQLMKTSIGKRVLGNRNPVRRKAGRLLSRYETIMEKGPSPSKDFPSGEHQGTHLELQSLRYGDLRNHREAGRIFRDARLRMKEARRSRRRNKTRAKQGDR